MSLLTPILWIAIIFPLLIIAKITTKQSSNKYIIMFISYFLLDCYARLLPQKYIQFEFIKYNWIGTILATLIALLFIYTQPENNRNQIGFTTKFNKELKFGLLIFLGFLLFDFIFKIILFPKGNDFEIEALLFQATMPGISEEIVFRGILIWLLSRAFKPIKKIKGIYFGWGFIIVTFTFAMMHGVVITDDLSIKVDYITIFYLTFITSLSLGLIRKFSGNIILPIFGHNLINIMNFFIRII